MTKNVKKCNLHKSLRIQRNKDIIFKHSKRICMQKMTYYMCCIDFLLFVRTGIKNKQLNRANIHFGFKETNSSSNGEVSEKKRKKKDRGIKIGCITFRFCRFIRDTEVQQFKDDS